MSEPRPTENEAPSKLARGVWRGINVLAAILAMVVLLGAAIIPSFMSGGKDEVSTGWRIAGIVALLVGLFVVTKLNDLSLLILALACGFFFASCVANFRWQGG